MSFFSKKKLLQIANDRGYYTERAVVVGLAQVLGRSTRYISYKLKDGEFPMAECEVIGAYFRMTMVEYYDTFMNGLFVETDSGKYVAHIDDYYIHLHPKEDGRKKSNKGRKKKELLEEIESF